MTQTYAPAQISFIGNDRVMQGSTFERQINLTSGGNPVVLTAYGGTPPTCKMRKTITEDPAYFTPVMSWINAAIGQMRIRIEAATSTAKGINQTVSNGVFHIEITNGADILRVVEGTWEMSAEVVYG